MKKIFLIIASLFFLTGCSQYTSMLGPSITLVETGSVLQATTSYGKSYTLSLARKNISEEKNVEKICPTYHSSDLSKIFFETQERDNCFFDPMSIYR
jgi:uncharacterized lipoprotein YajG